MLGSFQLRSDRRTSRPVSVLHRNNSDSPWRLPGGAMGTGRRSRRDCIHTIDLGQASRCFTFPLVAARKASGVRYGRQHCHSRRRRSGPARYLSFQSRAQTRPNNYGPGFFSKTPSLCESFMASKTASGSAGIDIAFASWSTRSWIDG